MLSESAHLAAKLQRDLLESVSRHKAPSSSSFASMTSAAIPEPIRIDRSVSGVLNALRLVNLSSDSLASLPSSSVHSDDTNESRRGGLMTSALRDCMCSILAELSHVIEQAAPEMRNARRVSSVPQTIESVSELLITITGVIHSINDKLLHLRFGESSSAAPKRNERSSDALHQQQHSVEQQPKSQRREAFPDKMSQHYHDRAKQEVPSPQETTTDELKREIRRLKNREDILLTKVRDLEIDCRVKAHTVASTTASAQAVFDENTILRQIAEHNQSLLREVDALHRCVAENETLHMEIDSKQKEIDTLKSRLREVEKIK